MASHAAWLPLFAPAQGAHSRPAPSTGAPHHIHPLRAATSASHAVPPLRQPGMSRGLLAAWAARLGLGPPSPASPDGALPLIEVLRRQLSAPRLQATKGYGALLLLYLMRFRRLRTALRTLLLWGGAAFALCANFHLSLDPPTCVKGVTVGVSRLVLVYTALHLTRRDDGLAPFYIGLAMRLVPVLMFFVFKGVYAAAKWTRNAVWGAPLLLPPPQEAAGCGSGEGSCCICLEDGCDYGTACGHAYHAACLAQWIERSPHCPLCHAPVRTSGGAVPLERYFLLDFERWKEWHMLCGDWWYERVV